jgi:hypothetical protein
VLTAVFHGNYDPTRTADPRHAWLDPTGALLLRQGERVLTSALANIMVLQFPDQIWVVNPETVQQWELYVTTERVVFTKPAKFKGCFEFLDLVDQYAQVQGIHPDGHEVTTSEIFHWVGQKSKVVDQVTLALQVALTSISSVSMGKIYGTAVDCIDFWFYDQEWETTQVQVFPQGLKPPQIFQAGVALQEASLREKVACIQKKHELVPTWDPANVTTHLTGLQRLVVKPDFLAMGSGDLASDSFDPIILQPHPLAFGPAVYPRSMTGAENVKHIDLAY